MKKQNVCPVEKAQSLDNKVRKYLQNPRKLLAPYIKNGMTVLDFGCGPGFFTLEIAKLLNGSGKVFAVDLQQGMLNKVAEKIKGLSFEQTVVLHKCSAENIGLSEPIDMILAFYVVHELPNKKAFFTEIKGLLKINGCLLIVEPKFHVTKSMFESMKNELIEIGYEIVEKPKIFFSRALLVKLKS